VLISRRTHSAIIALLEARIAELIAERDFYRSAWTERLGLKFVSSPGVTGTTSRPSEPEAPADRPDAHWSPDDRDIFFTWAGSNVPPGENPLHAWAARYGDESPVKVAIAGGW